MAKDAIKILIDTDLGDDTDDAAAVMMALNSPELEIVGITTVFKNTIKRAEMVIDLCEQYGRVDIPVYSGFGLPLIERPGCDDNPIQYAVLRQNCQEKISRDMEAVDFIIKSVKENPDLIIVGMGAMTNLGIAFYLEPQIMKTSRIIAMGGVFSSSSPEWNIMCDPEAARIVMDAADNLVMFGLDVTKFCNITDNLMQRLCTGSERMRYFSKGVEIFKKRTGYPVTFHDVLLIAYLIDPSIVELQQSDFNVELSGKSTRGSIVFKTNAYEIDSKTDKNYYYAKNIDVTKFRKLVLERIS